MLPLRYLPLIVGCAGCGETRTAAQIVLTPDPAIAPIDVVLRQIRRIDLVVDAQDGLRGVFLPGPQPGGGTAVDWDGDGWLEVRFRGPSPGRELPVLEIGVGENAGRVLAFRVFGFSSESETDLARAAGEGGTSASIPAGEIRRVGAPFNLTSRARPPQVLLVLPAEGATVPGNLGAITAVFSTTVAPETLVGHVHLTDPEGAALPVSSKVQTATVTGTSFGDEERSLLRIELASPIQKIGRYTVQIGPGIVSTAGHRFDQDPKTAAEDPFISHFLGAGESGGGHPCDACPKGFLCDDLSPRCLPALTCSLGCPKGFVCDPGQAQCVDDCRGNGLCFAPAASCDATTGLCRR